MKLTEALERMTENHNRVFNADYDGSPLQLWGDEDGCYVFALEGLFDAGMQWEFFKLDWVEGTE